MQVHGHFGSEQGQEMRLLSIAKKRGLFLQQKLGLVSALRPTGYFFFSFLSFAPLRWGWGAVVVSEAMHREAAVSNSSWPLGSKVLSLVL